MSVAARGMFLLLVLCPVVAAGQFPEALNAQVEFLSPDDQADLFDGFSLGPIVSLFRNDDLPVGDAVIQDLAKILPVERAAVHGRPGPLEKALTEKALSIPSAFDLDQIAAIDYGDAGFVWRVQWTIRPAKCGSTGLPWRYRIYVKPNGALVSPHRYLCDSRHCPEIDRLIFSTLPFDDVFPPDQEAETIHGDEALTLATEALQTFLKQQSPEAEPVRFRFRDQALVRLPLRSLNTGLVRVQLWEVRFIPANLEGEAIHNANPLKIWVTTDGLVSRLSWDEWSTGSLRAN